MPNKYHAKPFPKSGGSTKAEGSPPDLSMPIKQEPGGGNADDGLQGDAVLPEEGGAVAPE
jgi:hypothetical protein